MIEYKKAASPYTYFDGRELTRKKCPYKEMTLRGRDVAIIRSLAYFFILNSYWLNKAVDELLKKNGNHRGDYQKEVRFLFDHGYIERYYYADATAPLGSVDNPVFYTLSEQGRVYAALHKYPMPHPHLKENEAFLTPYLLSIAEHNQWHLSLKYSLSSCLIRCGYQEYVATSEGMVLLPSYLTIKSKNSNQTIYLFTYEAGRIGHLINQLLGANVYAKKRRPSNAIFLIAVPDQALLRAIFQELYSYSVLQTLPIYYAIDLFHPLLEEAAYEWIYHATYEKETIVLERLSLVLEEEE